jgi:hypothetical protein
MIAAIKGRDGGRNDDDRMFADVRWGFAEFDAGMT